MYLSKDRLISAKHSVGLAADLTDSLKKEIDVLLRAAEGEQYQGFEDSSLRDLSRTFSRLDGIADSINLARQKLLTVLSPAPDAPELHQGSGASIKGKGVTGVIIDDKDGAQIRRELVGDASAPSDTPTAAG